MSLVSLELSKALSILTEDTIFGATWNTTENLEFLKMIKKSIEEKQEVINVYHLAIHSTLHVPKQNIKSAFSRDVFYSCKEPFSSIFFFCCWSCIFSSFHSRG